MIQEILQYAYILSGITLFILWVSAVLSFFRMLKHKQANRSWFQVAASGFLKNENFSEQGLQYKRKFFQTTLHFFYVLAGMVVIVIIGIQTQG